jgi:hypothetical protein
MHFFDKMTIGSYLMDHHDFSEIEKERITKELNNDSLIKKIFYTNVEKSPIFKHNLKKINIPGFRGGTKQHTEKSIIQITKELTKGKNQDLAWKIYKEVIAEHINNEQENLNKLLENAILIDINQAQSTEYLLKLIAKNSRFYEISKDSFIEFYELWGFERIDNIENILSLRKEVDPSSLVLKLISDIEETVKPLKDQFNIYDKEFEESKKATNVLESNIQSLNILFEEVQSSITNFKLQLDSTSDSYKEKQQKTNDQLKNSLSELELNFSEVKSSLDLVSKEFSSQNNKLQSSLTSGLNKAKQSLKEEIGTLTKDHLSYIDSKLEEKLKDIKKLTHETPKPNIKYVSPLSISTPPKKLKVEKINEEWKFICVWDNYLKKDLDIHLPIQQVAILHILFKCSPSLIFDDDDIFRCWLHVLGWEYFNKDTVVTPLWTSESDWENEAKYLFSEDNIAEPRIITMNHYNVALVSCYLVPTLKMWDLKIRKQLAKIILNGSASESRKPTPDLLEFSTYILKDFYIGDLQLQYPLFLNNYKSFSGKELLHTGVNPETFNSWISAQHKEIDYNSDIDAVTKLAGIKIPSSLKNHFKKVYKGLNGFFSEEDALIVSIQHILIPWIENSNEISVSNYIENIDNLFPNRIKYIVCTVDEE